MIRKMVGGMPMGYNYIKISKFVVIIIGIAALSMLLINQTIGFYYKAALLESPCKLCEQTNKEQASCVNACFLINATAYLNPNGDIMDVMGRCYSSSGYIINCSRTFGHTPQGYNVTTISTNLITDQSTVPK
jgi:hypothetical protein